jgi:hypothetical protein
MTTKYMNISAIADYFAVSVSTVRGWVKQGLIPRDAYIKIGSTYRFDVVMIEGLFRTKSAEDESTEIDMEEELQEETEDTEALLETIDEDM